MNEERPAQLASNDSPRLDCGTAVDDPRIAKLRELLDQATALLNGANQLVSDLTEQLRRTSNEPGEPDQNSTLNPALTSRPR
jgi:ABC-type transporter Mla subunit MlaD